MLSLIRPSSSPCLHPDSFSPTGTANSNTISARSSFTKNTNAHSTSSLTVNTKTMTSAPVTVPTATTANTRPQLKSSASAPLSNAASYKELVAQFTARAPQPYGVIPPRKKRPQSLARSSSTSSITTAPIKNKNTTSSPSSPTETTSRNAVELQPTYFNDKTNKSGMMVADNNIDRRPLFHSLQSLLPESTSSSTRLGFWANLKAHYLAATTTSLSWPGFNSGSDHSSAARAAAGSEEFSPPIALRPSNSTPVAVVDATTLLSASLTLTDAFLSLPNLATPSAHAYHGSVNFPVSVAAMDKLKPVRSDTIPLKTFTYHETPVVERPQPFTLPLPHCTRSAKRGTNDSTKASEILSPPSTATKDAKITKGGTRQDTTLLPPLPRHLATRETRSNTDYLRMMAAELRMIRSRKLVSPLKPRGYLPRRKDPFRKESAGDDESEKRKGLGEKPTMLCMCVFLDLNLRCGHESSTLSGMASSLAHILQDAVKA
ncbi:hypothetical protein EDD11_009621 [Mortierella claussenii]|nr:hypothetical protein EDD11_009621 [Mortierella claussenii]